MNAQEAEYIRAYAEILATNDDANLDELYQLRRRVRAQERQLAKLKERGPLHVPTGSGYLIMRKDSQRYNVKIELA